MTSLVQDFMKSMLFNEEQSDLVFYFEDGTKIQAHQMVVYGRSEYFK